MNENVSEEQTIQHEVYTRSQVESYSTDDLEHVVEQADFFNTKWAEGFDVRVDALLNIHERSVARRNKQIAEHCVRGEGDQAHLLDLDRQVSAAKLAYWSLIKAIVEAQR